MLALIIKQKVLSIIIINAKKEKGNVTKLKMTTSTQTANAQETNKGHTICRVLLQELKLKYFRRSKLCEINC